MHELSGSLEPNKEGHEDTPTLSRGMECGLEKTYSVELHVMIREVYSITRLLKLNARNDPP
jgi:hypothetical protein